MLSARNKQVSKTWPSWCDTKQMLSNPWRSSHLSPIALGASWWASLWSSRGPCKWVMWKRKPRVLFHGATFSMRTESLGKKSMCLCTHGNHMTFIKHLFVFNTGTRTILFYGSWQLQLYRWGNWDSEKPSELWNVTEHISQGLGLWSVHDWCLSFPTEWNSGNRHQLFREYLKLELGLIRLVTSKTSVFCSDVGFSLPPQNGSLCCQSQQNVNVCLPVLTRLRAPWGRHWAISLWPDGSDQNDYHFQGAYHIPNPMADIQPVITMLPLPTAYSSSVITAWPSQAQHKVPLPVFAPDFLWPPFEVLWLSPPLYTYKNQDSERPDHICLKSTSLSLVDQPNFFIAFLRHSRTINWA